MSKRRRLTAFLAVGAIGAGAALAGPALGHDPKSESGSHNGEKAAAKGSADPAKAERRAARRGERMARRANRRAFQREVRKVGRMARRSMRHCHIAPDRLMTHETSKHLGLIKQIIDMHVEEGDFSPERAERKYTRWQQRVTMRTAMRTARWAPVLELFGADSRKALRDMKQQAGGWRELLDAKDVSRRELRTAKREGKIDRWQVVIDLCKSGMEGEKKPKNGEGPDDEEKPENGEKGGKEPSHGDKPGDDSDAKGSKDEDS